NGYGEPGLLISTPTTSFETCGSMVLKRSTASACVTLASSMSFNSLFFIASVSLAVKGESVSVYCLMEDPKLDQSTSGFEALSLLFHSSIEYCPSISPAVASLQSSCMAPKFFEACDITL